MGAMHNDLNRCTFMYADDRRRRNLIQNPGNPFCFYHSQPPQRPPARKPANPDDPAARAFFFWLASHPLDNATHLNQALNQLLLLRLRNRISARRADDLLRMMRLLLQSVPELRDEFPSPGMRERTARGSQFLDQIDELLSSAAQPSQPPAQYQEPASSHEPEPAPQTQQLPPQNQEPSHSAAVAATGTHADVAVRERSRSPRSAESRHPPGC